MLESDSKEHRLNEILDSICRIASLDFSENLKVRNDNSKEDLIVQALNMLSEEWKETVVSKESLIEKQDLLIQTSVQLKKANSLFEDTGKMTRTGSWELDLVKGKLFWSAITKEIHEVDQDYVPRLYTAIDYYKKGTSRDTISEVLEGAINKGTEYDEELELITAKNRNIWVRTIGKAEFENGEAVRLIGTFQDITNRKRKDDQILSFSNMVNNSSNEIYLFEASTLKFVYANKRACDNLGYTKEELYNLTPLAIKWSFTEQSFQKLVIPLIKSDVETLTFRTVHTRKDGSCYPVEIHLDLQKHDSITVFKAMVIDISFREKAELLSKHVSEVSSTVGGKEYFKELVCLLNNSLNAKIALVGEYLPEKNAIKTIACSINGEVQKNFTYPLKNSPCNMALGDDVLTYPKNLQKLFPKDEDLKIMEVESYSGAALYDEDNQPLGLIAVMDSEPIMDVAANEGLLKLVTKRTEAELKRLKTESELKLSEEKFRLLFENANDGILTINIKTKQIEEANFTAASNLGYKKEELIGRSIMFLYEQSNHSFVKGILNKLLKNGTITFETKQIRKDKTFLPVEVSANVINHGGKKVIQSIIRDISGRIEAEEEKELLFTEIKKSEERYKYLFYRNVAGVFRSNIKTGVLLNCNKAYAQIFGFESIEEILSYDIRNLYHVSEDRNNLVEQLNANSVVTNYKIKYKNIKGETIWGLLNASLIDNQYIEGTIVDITEQINAENQKQLAYEELMLIDSVNNIANSRADYHQITHHVFNLYKEQINGVGGRKYSYHEGTNTLSIDVESLDSGIIQKIEKKIGAKMSNYSPVLEHSKHYLSVIKHQKPFISSNPKIIAECIKEYTSNPLLQKIVPWVKDIIGIKSYIIIPIIVQGKTIGVYSMPSKVVLPDAIIHRLNRVNNQVSLILSRSLTEQSLKESEEQYRSLFEKMREGLLFSDSNGIIKFVNPHFSEITGYSEEELIGQNGYDLLHDSESKNILKSKILSRKKGESEQYEVPLIRKGGEKIWVSINASPNINNEQTFVGVMSTVIDITERKEAEKLKEAFTKSLKIKVSERTKDLEVARKKLEVSLSKEKELGELKSRFVATASHQFRTPLTVIQSNMSILSMQVDKMDDELKPKFEQVYERVKGQISRMTELMNDVLILGKINAGNVAIKLKPTDLVSICKDIIANFNEIEEDNRKVLIEVIGKERDLILDKQLIGYAVSNVVSNALKYSRGCVTPIFSITYSPNVVQVSIKDFGIGIFKNDLVHIFDPFYRGSNVNEISGTGLGTSITKEYVELNGGTIEMISEPDIGTEVIITFER